MCSLCSARFSATYATKIKFEIYGRRIVGHRKHLTTAEGTIKDLLDARDENGGERWKPNCTVIISSIPLVVKLDLVTPNQANAAKLFFTIKAVSDGNREDMKEAVAQAGLQGSAALPSMVDNAADAVETANPFVQGAISFTDTWGPVLKKLEAFQSIGTHLSEVTPFSTFPVLDVAKPRYLDSSIRKNGLVHFEFHTNGESISFEITCR